MGDQLRKSSPQSIIDRFYKLRPLPPERRKNRVEIEIVLYSARISAQVLR